MIQALILNGFQLLLKGIIDGFQRKASVKSLVACSIVLGAIGVLFIVASMEANSDNSYLAVGIVLIAVVVLLILLNTVFKKKDVK